jgi:hypothetical protein
MQYQADEKSGGTEIKKVATVNCLAASTKMALKSVPASRPGASSKVVSRGRSDRDVCMCDLLSHHTAPVDHCGVAFCDSEPCLQARRTAVSVCKVPEWGQHALRASLAARLVSSVQGQRKVCAWQAEEQVLGMWRRGCVYSQKTEVPLQRVFACERVNV